MTHWNKNFVFDLAAFAPDVLVWRKGGLQVYQSLWAIAIKTTTTKKTTIKTV